MIPMAGIEQEVSQVKLSYICAVFADWLQVIEIQ
jgi:hypothetical protein